MRPCHRILRCKLLLSFVDFVLGASERDYLFLENRFFLFGVFNPGSCWSLYCFCEFAFQGRAGVCVDLGCLQSRVVLVCVFCLRFSIQGRAGLCIVCVCMCLQSRVTLVCVNMCLQLRVVLVCVLLLRVCNPRSFAIQGCMAFLRSAMQGRAGLYCFCVFVRQGWAGLGIVVALCWTEVLYGSVGDESGREALSRLLGRVFGTGVAKGVVEKCAGIISQKCWGRVLWKTVGEKGCDHIIDSIRPRRL